MDAILRSRVSAHQGAGALQVGAGVEGESHHLFDDGLVPRRSGIFSSLRFQIGELFLPGFQFPAHGESDEQALFQMAHFMDDEAEGVGLVRELGGIQLEAAEQCPTRARGLRAKSHSDAARRQIVTRGAAFGASFIEAAQQWFQPGVFFHGASIIGNPRVSERLIG